MAFRGKNVHYAKPYYSGAIATTATFTFLTPGARQKIVLHGAMVSMDGAGYVELRSNGAAFMRLEFAEKKAVPIAIPGDVELPAGQNIQAYSNGANAYVTVVCDVHR